MLFYFISELVFRYFNSFVLLIFCRFISLIGFRVSLNIKTWGERNGYVLLLLFYPRFDLFSSVKYSALMKKFNLQKQYSYILYFLVCDFYLVHSDIKRDLVFALF